MADIILVAHGAAIQGAWSNPDVKIITKSGQALLFTEAQSYIGGTPFPEYASSSLGEFDPLSNADCMDLFGAIPGGIALDIPGSPGISAVQTGRNRKGVPVYALRGDGTTYLANIGLLASRNHFKIILAACRT